MARQFLRFLFSGGLATALQYVILGIGTYQFGWPAALASGVGYFAGSVMNYVLNYFFTFASEKPHTHALALFYVAVLIGLIINTLAMAILVELLDWSQWVAQVLATLLAFAWNFSASRSWVYRSV